MLNKEEILYKLSQLKLNNNDFIVLMGSSLVLHNIKKETNDINISVKSDIFNKLKVKYNSSYNDILDIIKYDVFEINSFDFNINSDYINEYYCQDLENIMKVKKKLNRKKDIKDIKAIDLYLCSLDNTRYEKELYDKNISIIAGVDEVGRGPLIGPVVASAVILPKNYVLKGLTDSKKLSEKKRNYYYDIIKKDALAIGIGIIDNNIIDEINIYEATKLAMKQAINNLNIKPQHILIDAMNLDIDIPITPIIKGDFKSQTIAAASVIAKVTRDKMMYELDKNYPEYNFKNNKGYPTKDHLDAIEKYGILKDHRKSYGPVKSYIENDKKVLR
jgi:ribonuclease HII